MYNKQASSRPPQSLAPGMYDAGTAGRHCRQAVTTNR